MPSGFGTALQALLVRRGQMSEMSKAFEDTIRIIEYSLQQA